MRACEQVQALSRVARRVRFPAPATRAGLAAACAAAILTMPAARAQQAASPPAPARAQSAPASMRSEARKAPPWFVTSAPPVAPATALAVLTCLASLLSCAVSLTLWQRADATQQAAHAAMQASAKLLDHAARRFARHQDEADGAIDAATSAASGAGQAAARLAAVTRETEARLSACLAGAESRLQTTLAGADDAFAGRTQAAHAIVESGVAAIAAAATALHQSTDAASVRLRADLHILPGLLAEALLVADARGVSAIKAASASLEALPRAAASVTQAAASLVQVQVRTEAILTQVEALAGMLPKIATSLASTAAGQRQSLAQAGAATDNNLQRLREAPCGDVESSEADLRRLA